MPVAGLCRTRTEVESNKARKNKFQDKQRSENERKTWIEYLTLLSPWPILIYLERFSRLLASVKKLFLEDGEQTKSREFFREWKNGSPNIVI